METTKMIENKSILYHIIFHNIPYNIQLSSLFTLPIFHPIRMNIKHKMVSEYCSLKLDNYEEVL